jgi:hypothetical protein
MIFLVIILFDSSKHPFMLVIKQKTSNRHNMTRNTLMTIVLRIIF